MAKIGTYDYPEYQFGTLLEAITMLVDKFNGQANDEKTFAEAIGHKTETSGAFLLKLADLRKYGLVDKRGITATERAKKIVKYLTPQERQQAINETIMEIRLWKDLFQRIKTKTPVWDDFKISLAELTADRETTIKDGQKIQNLYIDAISNYSEEAQTGGAPDEQLSFSYAQKTKGQEVKHSEVVKVSENLIVLRSGETHVSLPRTDNNIEVLISILRNMKEKKESEDTPK